MNYKGARIMHALHNMWSVIMVGGALAVFVTMVALAPSNSAHASVPAPESASVAYFTNCEDEETVPCVQWDTTTMDSGWHFVTSFAPYTATVLPSCVSEDTTNTGNVQCVWDSHHMGNGKHNPNLPQFIVNG